MKRRKLADLNWLMRQPIRNGRNDVQPKKWAMMPDLKGGEVMALALRKHGYGQKEIARRIGISQSIVGSFFARLGIPRRNPEASIRQANEARAAGYDRWILRTIAWVKRRVQRKQQRDLIGPRIPSYWRNVEQNRRNAKENAKRYWRERKNDPVFILAKTVRTRIRNAITRRHAIKHARTLELIGCDIDHFKKHLEAQFVDGMGWHNSGMWHIDHIRPIASFDLNDPAQQRAAFHYTNLQPLWGVDNRRKSSKWGNGKRWQRAHSTPPRRPSKQFSPTGTKRG